MNEDRTYDGGAYAAGTAGEANDGIC